MPSSLSKIIWNAQGGSGFLFFFFCLYDWACSTSLRVGGWVGLSISTTWRSTKRWALFLKLKILGKLQILVNTTHTLSLSLSLYKWGPHLGAYARDTGLENFNPCWLPNKKMQQSSTLNWECALSEWNWILGICGIQYIEIDCKRAQK